jgi:dipeptidyl aminopeptidase/acylaminoacyl peptidase
MKKYLLFVMVQLFLFTFAVSFSQTTAENYRRADSLSSMTTGKVFYGNVRPIWIGSTGSFFYENTTPIGTEYVLVNANDKSKKPAFDQNKFIVSFDAATGQKSKMGKLPIRNIVFSDKLDSFTFNYDGYSWTCKLSDYKIDKGEKVAERTGPNARGQGLGQGLGMRDPNAVRLSESPDKKWTAFIKNYNVYIRSAEDKKEYQLSFDGGIGEYYTPNLIWSSDSKKLIGSRVRPAEPHMISYVESSPADQFQPKYTSVEYAKPGDALDQTYPQLFDIESKKHLQVDESIIPNQFAISKIRWDKENRYFTFEYNKRGHQVYQVIKVAPNTGRTKVLINETSPTFVEYSGKYYRYDIPEQNEIIWSSERDGWRHLYLYDSETGTVKNQITKGNWVIRGVTSVDEKARQIVFQASGKEPGDPYFIHFYRINFDGTGLIKLTDGDGNHEVTFSPDKKFFIDTWSRVDAAPISVLRNTADGSKVIDLEKADIKKLLEMGIKLAEPFVAKGRDGVTDIYGVIIRPMNFDPKKKYPVIENIYAGPQGSFVPKGFRATQGGMHQLAELGFIVVQIDGMGTSNRSKAFHDVCWKNIGDAGFPDRILWLQAAAKKYPSMDITRVGIYGTSAGGQNAAGAVLFHPEFYKVAVASCGCHDNRMDKIWWNEQWMGWPVGIEYSQSSNIDNAWRLKGHLMLINGEMDDNVDPASTVKVVDALVKANKDFEYVLIPGAKHTSGGPVGERKRRDFFVKYLLGVNPPDWNSMEK